MNYLSRLWSSCLIVLIFIPACMGPSTEEGKDESLFIKMDTLASEIVIKPEQLLDPSLIAVTDSLIVLCNRKGKPLIEAYNLQGDMVGKFLDYGKGPNEILIAGNLQVDKESEKFYINDLIGKKVLELDLNKMDLDKEFSPKICYNQLLDSDISLMFDKILLGKEVFICESRSEKGRLLLLDKNGKQSSYYLKYPLKEEISNNLTDIENARLYSSSMCISPDKKKIALAAYSAGMIDLIKIEDQFVEKIFSICEYYPKGVEIMNVNNNRMVVHTDESQAGYLHVCCTSKHVYALYSGKKRGKTDYSFGNRLRVLSWDGKLKNEFIVDKRIKRIAVSEEDEFLYGISLNRKHEPEILRFKL